MKAYDIMYKNAAGKWAIFELGADSEAKAEKYASELKRDYPEVCKEYIILWEVR